MQSQYRIYVACLSSYNNGWLHGKWIDATQGVDHINEEVQTMLKESPVTREYDEIAEEWAIHDYELGGVRIDEWESFERVADIGELLSSGEYPVSVIEHVIGENQDAGIDEIRDILQESYLGEYEDGAAYAQQFCQETGSDVAEWLESYVDYQSMARDWVYSGDINIIDNGYKSVYILRRY